jgi:hypothetical protein
LEEIDDDELADLDLEVEEEGDAPAENGNAES